MDKKIIIIATTSINRPLLHSNNIPDWYKWIYSVDKNKYNIYWFINIDWIENLESTVEETKINYENIIKEIDLHFLESDTKKGNFLHACKRVSSNIENFVKENNFNYQDVIIIWLEDDWELNPSNIPLETLIDNYLSNLTAINLSFIRNNYIHALAPIIITYNLWSKLHLKAWKNQSIQIDPEHCVGLYFIKNYCKYEYINNITVIFNKKINENYFKQTFLNYEKSYYTYFLNENNLKINEKYIKNDEVKEFCKDKITFIRITNSFCGGVNFGRDYLKKYDLIKNKIQDEKNSDFYK